MSKHNFPATELALTALRHWSETLEAQSVARAAFTYLIEFDGQDLPIRAACVLIADALLGEGNWDFANAGEAAITKSGCSALDFCAEGWPLFCSPEGMERDEAEEAIEITIDVPSFEDTVDLDALTVR
jgi:hypothetical protein